jgi:hypothetical protein
MKFFKKSLLFFNYKNDIIFLYDEIYSNHCKQGDMIFLHHSIKFEYVNIILFAFDLILLFKIENVFDFTRCWDVIKSETMSQGK